MKPKEFVIYIRENLTNKFAFSSTFSMHYLSKFSDEELINESVCLKRKLLTDEEIELMSEESKATINQMQSVLLKEKNLEKRAKYVISVKKIFFFLKK